ncbi:MAG TPA: 4a-hydroxytetrahydrobiopterin dehydratase, partial [Candidatus Poseidoniales archaeon]|nr:4a-hydroxytetrahydrobiopterin dehydratase [Candidatus Poseidoniales archaeon]
MEEAAALDLLSQINGDWNLVEVHHLERVWTFRDFLEALDFVNQAGA